VASGGYPRLVNILAHKALMVAYGRGMRSVTAEHVRLAVADTEGVADRNRPRAWTSVLVATALLLMVALALLTAQGQAWSGAT
jgi:MSHA biogenesis protein MshM